MLACFLSTTTTANQNRPTVVDGVKGRDEEDKKHETKLARDEMTCRIWTKGSAATTTGFVVFFGQCGVVDSDSGWEGGYVARRKTGGSMYCGLRTGVRSPCALSRLVGTYVG